MKLTQRRVRRQLMVLFGFILGLIWLGAYFELERNYQAQINDVKFRTQAQSELFAEYALSTIKRIDELILDTRDDWNGDWFAFAEKIKKRQNIVQDISFQVAVINAKGIMVFSNLSKPNTQVDLSERKHFQVHRDHPERDDLYISNPVKGKVSNKWSLQFTRPIFKANQFAGVMVLSVDPQQFTAIARKFNSPAGSVIAVLRDSGEVMARYPDFADYLGKVIDTHHMFASKEGISGNFQRYSQVDAIERMYGYRRLDDYHLVFAVGEPIGFLTTAFQTYRRTVISFAVMVSLICSLIFWYLFKAQQRLIVMQARLAEREQTLRTSQKVGRIGSFTLDLSSKQITSSGTLLSILGCDEQYPLNLRNWLRLIAPAYRLSSLRTIKTMLSTNQRFENEYPIIRQSDQQLIWVSSHGQIYFDSRGKAEKIVGILQDITERKRHEDELTKAKELAEAANTAKSLFLATMSHEIRTPMNGIIGMTDLMLETALNKEQKRYLDLIKSSSDALMGIINDILDSSKIEAGKLTLENLDFDLAEEINVAIKTLAIQAEKKGLELIADIELGLSQQLKGDPNRIRQILFNVVGNAIKFTQTGEVTVNISCNKRYEDEIELHFKISDTGIGIAADKQQAIFELFSQADNSVTRKYGGTGLGLSISSRLLELMGGKIWVESQVGRGSTFHFLIALPFSDLPAKSIPISLAAPAYRTLVVDDNVACRQFLLDSLIKWGMSPYSAESATEAIAEISHAQELQQRFELLIIDADMPVISGYQLLQQIQQSQRPNLPHIIMLTSVSAKADQRQGWEEVVDAFLPKPVTACELRRAISNIAGISEALPGLASSLNQVKNEYDLPNLKILLVEDNEVNQQVVLTWLSQAGHQVTLKENGQQAVAAVAQAEFDLVLMDVQMPVMDGLQATRLIRQQETQSGKHLPIIAMTANVMSQDATECLAAGMDTHIAKPISRETLFAGMAKVLPNYLNASNASSSQLKKTNSPDPLNFDYEAAVNTTEAELLEIIGKLALNNIPGNLLSLQQAMQNEDSATAIRAAHTLKGVVAYFSAQALSDLAQTIEDLLKQGKFKQALEYDQILQEGVAKLLAALRKKLDLTEAET